MSNKIKLRQILLRKNARGRITSLKCISYLPLTATITTTKAIVATIIITRATTTITTRGRVTIIARSIAKTSASQAHLHSPLSPSSPHSHYSPPSPTSPHFFLIIILLLLSNQSLLYLMRRSTYTSYMRKLISGLHSLSILIYNQSRHGHLKTQIQTY